MDNSVEMKTMLEAAMKAHPKSFANFDTTKNVQDQLQEMVKVKLESGSLMDSYLIFKEDYYDGMWEMAWHHYGDIWVTRAKTFEQLWLAFVQKELYGKVWSGVEWINL